MATLLVFGGAVVFSVALASCSSSPPAPVVSTSTSSPSTTLSAPASSVAALTTTAVTGPCTSTQGCAQALYSYWANGDQTEAAQVASSSAVSQIFAAPYGQLQTNEGPVGPYQSGPACTASVPATCTWTGQDQQLQMTVSPAAPGEFQVTEVKKLGG